MPSRMDKRDRRQVSHDAFCGKVDGLLYSNLVKILKTRSSFLRQTTSGLSPLEVAHESWMCRQWQRLSSRSLVESTEIIDLRVAEG